MARTIVGLNDPKAVKKYATAVATDTAKIAYFNKKFMGYGAETSMPIQMLSHLEQDAGEQISFDLSLQLKMQPVEGDNPLEGKEEDLKFYTDNVWIDQLRGGVNTGGRMTRKRTIHDLRKIARTRQSDWWSRVFDELFFMYLSGARGLKAGFLFPTSFAGFANNAFTAPDAEHLMYPGVVASKAALAATDKMTTNVIDRVVAQAQMMGGDTEETPQIQPVMVDGEEHYVLVMNPWQAYDLRQDTGASGWLEINKAAAGAEGNKSNIFKGALGMHNGVVLHQHKRVIRFNDYGAGLNVEAARGLFLGAQAAVCAFGSPGTGLRFDWHEESRDNGNQAVISTSTIVGIKKCVFGPTGAKKDFGIIAVDTAAKKP